MGMEYFCKTINISLQTYQVGYKVGYFNAVINFLFSYEISGGGGACYENFTSPFCYDPTPIRNCRAFLQSTGGGFSDPSVHF